MAKQEKGGHKKSRGRPAGRAYAETVPVRLTPEMLKAIEGWCRRNKVDNRSEALRQLIEHGLEK
jgi:metal-responsive CopG/Arc/MetJ family transcriptional regulator